MVLARWILMEGASVWTVLAPDDADRLGARALGAGRPTFHRRGAALASAWLPRPLVLAVAEELPALPPVSDPLMAWASLDLADDAPGPPALQTGTSDEVRLAALDELLACWADLASELDLSPLALGVREGQVWARLDPARLRGDEVVDRLLLLREAFGWSAEGRGLALARLRLDEIGGEVAPGLYQALAGAGGAT